MGKAFFIFLILAFMVVTSLSFVTAQEQGSPTPEEQDKGFLDNLSETLGSTAKEVLEEKLEEWKKTYKGKVTAVKVLKEEPDHIVLEVSFEDVKRPEETYVTGEVLFGGVPASNFVVDRIPLTEKRGSLRLNVYYVEPETYEMEAGRSDQIVVYLYPAGAPEKRFGEYYLALVRTWGSSSEEEAGITLTDESSPTNEEAKPSPVIPEGSFPYPKLSPVFFTKTYDFYDKAELAQWRSSYGTLPFSGNPNDRRGFVRKISAGHLSTGNNARKLLETRPPRERRGWIEGEYPALVLAKGVHFQAAAGFLKGAQASDGAIFKLYVKDSQGHRHRVLAQYVRPGRYVHLDADLSRFAGQKVALILHVSAWRTPTQDWAVWVAPRLTIP